MLENTQDRLGTIEFGPFGPFVPQMFGACGELLLDYPIELPQTITPEHVRDCSGFLMKINYKITRTLFGFVRAMPRVVWKIVERNHQGQSQITSHSNGLKKVFLKSTIKITSNWAKTWVVFLAKKTYNLSNGNNSK